MSLFPLDFVDIVAAGAMGICAILVIFAYSLIKEEQTKEKPRAVISKLITGFQKFGITVIILAFLIELSRHYTTDSSSTEIKGTLEKLSTENFYSFDSEGNPKRIELSFNDSNYIISQAFPNNLFEDEELKLAKDKKDDTKYAVTYKRRSNTITWGYLNAIDFPTPNIQEQPSLKAEDLLMLGLAYAPWEIKKMVSTEKEPLFAIKYLVEVLDPRFSAEIKEQKKAVKALIQPLLMNSLNPTQQETLINTLKKEIRPRPNYYWELAQVYKNRLSKKWESVDKQADTDNYYDYLQKFVDNYKDTDSTKIEFQWYIDSKAILDEKYNSTKR